jgi:DNA-binding NarL/FixJ family response regulator
LIRLGIVDDQPVFRLGLLRTFEREPDLVVIWELGSASELLKTLPPQPVDVVLMDLNLGPNEDALAATSWIREHYSDIKVIVISASLEWEGAAAVRHAGACGYLPKDLSVADMVAAIRGLALQKAGGMQFSDLLAARHNGNSSGSRHGLTRREQEVLGELRRGHTNREIAIRLNVSITTVNKHVQQVLKKLRVRTRAQAVALLHAEAMGRIYQNGGSRPDALVG